VLDPSFLQDVNVSVLPRADNTYDLGSPTLRWRRLFLGDYAVTRSLLGSGRRFALRFDGVDDYVDLPYNFGQPNTITIEVLFRTTQASWDTIFGQTNVKPPSTASAFISVFAVTGDGRLRAELWTGTVGEILTDFSVRDGRWHHAVMVGNVDIQSLYVDGVFIGSRSGTIQQGWWLYTFVGTGFDHTRRGFPYTGWHYFNGEIALARVYNRALTSEEVVWNYLHPDDPVRDGLVLWLRMDEGYGNMVYDLSGLGNNGTIYGATWAHTEAPVGLGAEREVLTSKYIVGRLGVGTTAPAERLHVAGNIRSHSVLPDADNAYNLGSSTLRWRDLHLAGNASVGGVANVGSLQVGGATVVDGSRRLMNVASVAQSLLPDSDGTFDLGSPTLRWRDVYAMVVKGALISLD